MNVRGASFRDLGRIEQLHRDAMAREEGAVAGVAVAGTDSPVPQTALVRLWFGITTALSALVPSEPSTSLLVAEDGEGGLAGFIAAQSVPGQPKAWHVSNLCVAPTALGHFAATQLVAALCLQGSEHGVGRFMVRVPLGHSMLSVFLEQGFAQYATEQILFRDDVGGAPRLAAAVDQALRPARREDVGAIHLLYRRTTPSTVANVEGPSQKAWQASFLNGTMARLGRDDTRHLVCERSGVVAWVAVRASSPIRPTLLALMVDGQDAVLREEVVDAALAQIPPGPVSCILRHYDSELARSLLRRGFEVLDTQLLLVRDRTVRVAIRGRLREKKPVLVHAGMAGTMTPLGPALARLAPMPLLLPPRPLPTHQRSATPSLRR